MQLGEERFDGLTQSARIAPYLSVSENDFEVNFDDNFLASEC